MRDCVRGRTALMAWFIEDIICSLERQDSDNSGRRLYIIPNSNCRKTQGCSSSLTEILGKLAKSAASTGRIHPFDVVEDICISMFPADNIEYGVFCDNCYGRLSSAFEGCRRGFWQNLPTFFILPAWETMMSGDELDM